MPAPLVIQGQNQAGAPIPMTQSQGMWTGDAVGVQVQRNAADPAPDGVLVRSAGVAAGTLGEWSVARFGATAAEHPDYSQASLFEDWVPALFGKTFWNTVTPAEVPVFGGMSTGGDICPPIAANGNLMMGANVDTWAQFSVTVAPTPNSSSEGLMSTVNNPSGHIFSYCADGSTAIDLEFVDANRIEYSRGQMRLLGPGPNQRPNITALDWGMGRISETPNGVGGGIQPVRNLFFFTFSEEWVTYWNSNNGNSTSGLTPTSEEIYYMRWANDAWSQPAVAVTSLELFGTAFPSASIDALSVDARDTGGAPLVDRVVFSLRRNASNELDLPADPILVTQFLGTTVYAQPLRVSDNGTAAGTPVSVKLGIREDGPVTEESRDPQGICSRDPNETVLPELTAGVPVDGVRQGPWGVGVSVFRVGENNMNTIGDMIVQVHGLDHAGLWFSGCEVAVNYVFVDQQGDERRHTYTPPPVTFLNDLTLTTSETRFDMGPPDQVPLIPSGERLDVRVRATHMGWAFGATGFAPVATSWESSMVVSF